MFKDSIKPLSILDINSFRIPLPKQRIVNGYDKQNGDHLEIAYYLVGWGIKCV